MKEFKREAKEWIFENLLRLILKFSNNQKIIRFQKIPHHRKQNEVDYNLIIRSKSSEDKGDLKERLENYLTDLTNKDVFKTPSAIYPGKFCRTNSSSHEGKVLNGEESYLNLTYKKLQKEDLEKITESYKDLQVRTLKRAINENGYEIISEVKNGFIIARKDRHNETIAIKPIQGEPSDYTHKLIGSLKDSDELIKDSLSTSDFGGEDLVAEDLDNQLREQEQIDFNKFTEEEEIKKFAKENRLYRFLDEDPDKYMKRVKSAMRSKFTKSSLHPMSGVIDTIVESSKVAKSINELAKTFDKKSTVTEFKEKSIL